MSTPSCETIYTPLYLSEVFQVLPLNQFRCYSNLRWLFRIEPWPTVCQADVLTMIPLTHLLGVCKENLCTASVLNYPNSSASVFRLSSQGPIFFRTSSIVNGYTTQQPLSPKTDLESNPILCAFYYHSRLRRITIIFDDQAYLHTTRVE